MILEKIETRTARAGVIGLGYVGLPLTVAIASAGFRVTGIDICSEKIARLKQSISDIPDVTKRSARAPYYVWADSGDNRLFCAPGIGHS